MANLPNFIISKDLGLTKLEFKLDTFNKDLIWTLHPLNTQSGWNTLGIRTVSPSYLESFPSLLDMFLVLALFLIPVFLDHNPSPKVPNHNGPTGTWLTTTIPRYNF